MGSCKITFDASINQKSDSNHSDNGWMVAFWFVKDKRVPGGGPVPCQSYNQSGNAVLESGQTLEPVILELPCHDADPVTLVYSVANFGSTGPQSRRSPQKSCDGSVSSGQTVRNVSETPAFIRYSPVPCGRLPVAWESVYEVRLSVKQGCLPVGGRGWMAMSEVVGIFATDVMKSSRPRHGQTEINAPFNP